MSRVFIIEQPRSNIDISRAEQFGELVYLFDSNARRCSVFHHHDFGRAILEQLVAANFDYKDDYVCIVGSMLTVAVALIAIAQSFDTFKALLFNSVESEYVERRFDKSSWVLV
jgi:hypothetical protein